MESPKWHGLIGDALPSFRNLPELFEQFNGVCLVTLTPPTLPRNGPQTSASGRNDVQPRFGPVLRSTPPGPNPPNLRIIPIGSQSGRFRSVEFRDTFGGFGASVVQ